MNNDIISLDLETSGNDLSQGDTILSIGMVHLNSMSEYYVEVKHDRLIMQPAAARIHKLDMTNLDGVGRELMSDVDLHASRWIQDVTGVDKQWKLVPLGWNIASFDMPFVSKYLPRTAARYGFRSVDLNALCTFIDDKKELSAGSTKKTVKENCPNLQAHNALSDAQQAAYCYRELMVMT